MNAPELLHAVTETTEPKRVATLRARFALQGWQVIATDRPGRFVVARWDRWREVAGLEELERLLANVEGDRALG